MLLVIIHLFPPYCSIYASTVHDGKWRFGPRTHPHKRDQISEFQGRRWQFCVQQRKGLKLNKLFSGPRINHHSGDIKRHS